MKTSQFLLKYSTSSNRFRTTEKPVSIISLKHLCLPERLFFCIKTSVQIKHKTLYLYPLMGFYTVLFIRIFLFCIFFSAKEKNVKIFPQKRGKKSKRKKKDFPINMKIGLKYLLYQYIFRLLDFASLFFLLPI